MERPLMRHERWELITQLLVNTFVSVPEERVRSIARSALNWTYMSDDWLLNELAKDEAKADV